MIMSAACEKCSFHYETLYDHPEHDDDPGEWQTDCATFIPGDIVEVSRGLFSHFAIYTGQDHLIHVTVDSDDHGHYLVRMFKDYACSFVAGILNKVKVIESPVDKVALGCSMRRNNLVCHAYNRGLSMVNLRHEILKIAHDDLGKSYKYGFFSTNCEYYAAEVRYGTGFSVQADDFNAGIGKIINSIKVSALSLLILLVYYKYPVLSQSPLSPIPWSPDELTPWMATSFNYTLPYVIHPIQALFETLIDFEISEQILNIIPDVMSFITRLFLSFA